jgi:hypothetical protein
MREPNILFSKDLGLGSPKRLEDGFIIVSIQVVLQKSERIRGAFVFSSKEFLKIQDKNKET